MLIFIAAYRNTASYIGKDLNSTLKLAGSLATCHIYRDNIGSKTFLHIVSQC